MKLLNIIYIYWAGQIEALPFLSNGWALPARVYVMSGRHNS